MAEDKIGKLFYEADEKIIRFQSHIAKLEGKLERHRRAFKRIQFISRNWNDTNAVADECYLVANRSLAGIASEAKEE